MADSSFVKKPLLEKIQNLLARKPEHNDVAFCVGKEKKIVRALKVILKASSPFLEKEFDEEWDNAVIKDSDGIPLPDFDPIAFELFVKLTSLDAWSLETLKTLNLQRSQILNLLSICQRFVMEEAVENLEILASTFMQSFGEYKDTDDFLQLSQRNLKYVLGSDDISIKELDVFRAAMRWADFQCKQAKVEPTEEKIREVLDDCLFEIRFPTMTCAEFTEARGLKDILTAEENLGIYGFIGLADSKTLKFDTKKLPFKITQREQVQALDSGSNNSVAITLPAISTLHLTLDPQIMENPPFVCDNSSQSHFIACEKKVTVFGLGFFGPIESDGFYDVKVQIRHYYTVLDSGTLEKRIFGQKGKPFYFFFDKPIHLEAGSVSALTYYYIIDYHLKGANTSACNRKVFTEIILQERDTKFRFEWRSRQLAEILFKLS